MITVNHLLILQNAGAGLWPASLLCCWKHAHRYLVPWISETTRLNRPHVRTRAASTMHYFISKGAAALLALASFAMAVGTAHIVNNCGFPIYYASVGQSQHAEMQELQGSYSESYTQPGVGISIKLSPSMNGPVSQFEFTWADGKIYYDLSNIDGFPFADAGMTLVPSMIGDGSNPTCQEVDCPAGQAVCSAAYNNPDDVRTTVCSDQSDLTLTICPGGSGSSTASPSTGVNSSESSSPATMPTSANTTQASSQRPASPTWRPGYHARHLAMHA